MTEVITDDILDKFQQITLYDIRSFFGKFLDFNETDYPNITNFYSGTSVISPTSSFANLNYLIKEQKKIIDITISNSALLDNYQYWALIEYVEDIGQTLETAFNSSKWLRSSVSSSGYKQQVRTQIIIKQGQGLEDVERVTLKSTNSRDSWVETALENSLAEEDYDLLGGHLIKVTYKNNTSLSLNSVVDNIDSSEKTYGLDIDDDISIVNDDLVVLGYQDTIFQSAKILANLKEGDDPAFPNRGISKNIIGSSSVGITYPVLFRQLAGNFATDDTFKSFSITNVERQQDAIFAEFTVETRAGEVFDDKVQL